jgi:protein MPE1
MSHVFYKFSSSKTESRVTFDGTHISLFDLKKEIIIANKMGAGGMGGRDFDLGVYDNVTNEGESALSNQHVVATPRDKHEITHDILLYFSSFFPRSQQNSRTTTTKSLARLPS